jgi:hypothetical protein
MHYYGVQIAFSLLFCLFPLCTTFGFAKIADCNFISHLGGRTMKGISIQRFLTVVTGIVYYLVAHHHTMVLVASGLA